MGKGKPENIFCTSGKKFGQVLMLKQASKTMGHCRACSTAIEAADWFDTDAQVHAECRTLQEPEPSESELTSGFLFSYIERKTVEKAKETVGVKRMSFDGATLLGIDTPRLAGQLARVFELMRDGQYRTLTQIATVTGCLPTSASSRLRDFRKRRFGSYQVLSRRVEGTQSLYEYRLVVNATREDEQRDAA